jgi:DNA polymerase (family 10)
VNIPSDLRSTLQELADWIEIRTASPEAGQIRRSAGAGAIPAFTSSPFVTTLLQEVASGNGSRALSRIRAAVPSMVRHLFDAGLMTPPALARLVRHGGVVTLDDLGLAADDGRLARLFGEGTAGVLRKWLDTAGQPGTPLGRAHDVADALLVQLARAAPTLTAVEPAGGIRRCDSLVSGIVIVARSDDPGAAVHTIAQLEPEPGVLHRSARRVILNYRQAEVDVRVAAPDEHGTVLFTTTGSRAHYRGMLTSRGRGGIYPREEQVYASAGLPWIAPELREGTGEIEAAAAGRLPTLIEPRHIRGDLHMHSTYSDGRDSVDAMVSACHELGYEYIAITDHSEGAAASRTLAASEVPRQREEIARLRERYPGMAILHGVEVDILPGGGLDFTDAILEGFDIVLASLHDDAGHDRARLTKRCLAAIRHPLVTVISHPSNRLVGRRDGYPLDFDAIFAAAAETGTALEIDGAPGHLDLDGARARAAAQAGVTLAIDSDCHRASSLRRQMLLGVGTARRGWIEPAQVLTARPIEAVRAFIRAKRQGLFPGGGA